MSALGLESDSLLEEVNVDAKEFVKVPTFESDANVFFVFGKVDFLEHFSSSYEMVFDKD
mgnify:CR=1 FL=1